MRGFDFDVVIHVGAGAYVCGEESALIESLEGRRGVPRIRPPFPVERGYLGRPTVVNNVETFVAVAHILRRGGAWWAAIGTLQSTGTKLHSVSGDCARPGVYEYPLGTPLQRILADCGAADAQAVQVGGPSGTCVPAAQFGRAIAFEDLPSAGALMVFDRSRDLFEVARHFARFFAHESCGLCTPCRVGTELVVRRLDKLAQARGAGRGSAFDVERLRELDALLHGGTHCGLGMSACNPLRDTLAHFAGAYAQRAVAADFQPDLDLDALLEPTRRAGHEVPHLCWDARVSPSASCRLCTVLADGRPVAACATPAQPGQRVQCHVPVLAQQRLRLLQLLFVEGHHFCPGCEKSGACRLQAAAARAGMTELHFEALDPDRRVDASHPDVWFEPGRCILCQLCVRASDELDGKRVFAIGGRGLGAHLLIDSPSGRLGDSALSVHDAAAHICPVGALLPKRVGFAQPIGRRPFDDAETRG